MKQLIHFVDLEDLLPELLLLTPVRIASLVDDENVAYVTVRQIQGDCIYMWSYIVGTYTKTEEIDELAETSRIMEEEVRDRVKNYPGTLNVKPGIIDLEDRSPIFGVWRAWEELYQDEEE